MRSPLAATRSGIWKVSLTILRAKAVRQSHLPTWLLPALGPDNSKVLSLATLTLRNFEPDTGMQTLERAVTLNPNSAFAWGLYAWSLVFSGEHEQALQALE